MKKGCQKKKSTQKVHVPQTVCIYVNACIMRVHTWFLCFRHDSWWRPGRHVEVVLFPSCSSVSKVMSAQSGRPAPDSPFIYAGGIYAGDFEMTQSAIKKGWFVAVLNDAVEVKIVNRLRMALEAIVTQALLPKCQVGDDDKHVWNAPPSSEDRHNVSAPSHMLIHTHT